MVNCHDSKSSSIQVVLVSLLYSKTFYEITLSLSDIDVAKDLSEFYS